MGISRRSRPGSWGVGGCELFVEGYLGDEDDLSHR